MVLNFSLRSYLALAVLLGAAQAHAATITVTTAADVSEDDGLCSLREAVSNADWDMQMSSTAGECAAGSGADLVVFDTVAFPAGQVTPIPLTPGWGTMYVTSAAQLVLDGGGRVAIDAQGDGRMFSVEPQWQSTASLKLVSLELRNGKQLPWDHGGAVMVQMFATLEVENSVFRNNSAPNGNGGAIAAQGGVVMVTGSTFVGNTALQGGAIHATGSLTITNSTVTGNAATLGGTGANGGGGIYTTGTTQLSHVTLVNNTGSGVRFNPQTNSQLVHSILASNSGGNCQNAPDVASGNLFADDLRSCTTAMGIVGDAMLGALSGANGGLTPTMLPGVGSAARDAVPCLNGVNTDQRGVSRPMGAQCDIGAVERRPDYSLTVAVSGDTSSSVSAAAVPAPAAGGVAACTSAGGVTCTAVYAEETTPGALVSLTATPGAGSRFTGWGGACAEAGSSSIATVTVDRVLACTAAFELLPLGPAEPAQPVPVPTLSQAALAVLAMLMAALARRRLYGQAGR